MPSTILISMAVAAIILSVELIMWRLFYRKVAPLCFEEEADNAFFLFFRLWRLRLLAIIHTIFLLLLTVVPLAILW